MVPTSLDQPETVVARGALRAVLLEPDRTGVLPGSSIPGQSDHRTEIVRGDAPTRRALPPVPNARNAPAQPPRGFSPADPARGPQSGPFVAAGPGGPSPLRTGPGQNALGQNGSGNGVFAVPSADPPGDSGGKAKKRRQLWLVVAAVAVVALIAGGVVYFVNRGGDDPDQGRSFSQYDFSLVAPNDWVQTTDEVADRQVILHPQDAERGNDLVLAQEFVMDYDATADRRKLVDALQSGVSGNTNYTAFHPDLTYGGRSVIGYVESKPERITVRWYVLVQGRIRVHVGCQYQSPAVQQRVDAACEQVVRTLKITS